jgi:hypothetical protein
MMHSSRRQLLQFGLLGMSGLPLTPAFTHAAVASRARSCLLLYMDGGPSHIDLFDLKPAAPTEIRGPYRPISTSVPGTQVCEHLPRLAQQMHRVLQVRSMRHEEMVHDPAVYQMLTGFKHISSAGGLKVEETDLPHMGSALAMADRARSPLPKFIHAPDAMKMDARVLPGQRAGILPAAFDPFQVDVTRAGEVIPPVATQLAGESPERLARQWSLLESLNREHSEFDGLESTDRLARFREQAFDLACNPAAQAAFNLKQEPAAIRDKYGRHRHGQSVLLARRLIEAGSRFVTVYWGNEEQDWADGKGERLANNPWDTHRNHFPLVTNSLLPRADQTFAALLEDLAQRGMLDETLVIWMGDFGRTPYISKPWASRDHWPHAFTVLLAGAGIRGGAVYGGTDRHAAHVEENPVTPADLTATIFSALGIPPDTIVSDRQRRPHRLSTGRAMTEWFL